MRGKKILRLLRQSWLPFSALVLLACFLLLCRGRVQTAFPVLEPEDGVVDARDVDFAEGVYHITHRVIYHCVSPTGRRTWRYRFASASMKRA